MVQFLSPEWVEALDRAATSRPVPCATELVGLVLEYDIEDAGYHMVFGPSGLRVHAGPADTPTVTFRSDRATAHAIARAELSAQRAFMAGRLRVDGDAAALVRAHAAIAALPDLFAAVRPDTEW